MQSPPFPRYLVPPRSKYSPQHVFSNTLSFLSSLNVSDQVSHPYKTTRSVILRIRNISEKIIEKIKTHVLCSKTFFDRAVYEIMWKNMVEPDRS
jgi:hypothetical protein